MPALLVTGMQRSGTTLVQRLLDAHPEVTVLPQPLPLLHANIKRAFLDTLPQTDRLDAAYPLGPRFGEERYQPADFTDFLTTFPVTRELVRQAYADMADYSGQWTRVSPEVLESTLDRLEPSDLATALTTLTTAFGGDSRIIGSKEILCEEFLPHVLDGSGHGVLVLRDPRAVMASSNLGSAREWTGRPRPLLFDIRNWRKSAAFALHLRGTRGFACVSYDELVTNPAETLAPATEALGVSPLPDETIARVLADRRNSSHDGISSELPPETARFVEAACLPEMVALGMPLTISAADVPRVLADSPDQFPGERPELADQSGTAAREAEVRRFCALVGSGSARDAGVPFDDVRELLTRKLAECETITP